ncbi:MAG: ABC transporter ATP-binding protein [Nitrososphaerota archaeon]
MNNIILKVVGLKKYYPIKTFLKTLGWVKAVDGVDFEVKKGETFGLAGESGCGKSTLGRTIIRLIEPTEGNVIFKDKDITKLSKKGIKELRRKMQIVFQDPYQSLNPRMTVYAMLNEVLNTHFKLTKEEIDNRIIETLRNVGLTEAHMYRYPHELSGGERQRVSIARALILKPEFIVLDEPTSALDVSVQAKILNLLRELQKKFDLSYLFISHDLMIVKYMSERVGIMYLGKIVEIGNSHEIFNEPLHPYTRMLIESIPIPDPKIKRKVNIISGEVPSSINPPPGCRFHPRCPYAMEICKEKEPVMLDIRKNHRVSCYLYH